MSAAMSRPSFATWSRPASPCCAEQNRKGVEAKAELAAEERMISALVGEGATADTRVKFRRMLRSGELEDKEIEVSVGESQGMPIGVIDMPQNGALNLGDMMKGMFGKPAAKRNRRQRPIGIVRQRNGWLKLLQSMKPYRT